MEKTSAQIERSRPEEEREVQARVGGLWSPWPKGWWESASDGDNDCTRRYWWVARSNHQIRRRTIDLPEHDRAARGDDSRHDPGTKTMRSCLLAKARLDRDTAGVASTNGKMVDKSGSPLVEEAQARMGQACGASGTTGTWKGTREKMRGTGS